MNLEHLATAASFVGIEEESIQVHTDESGFCGLTFSNLTPDQYESLVQLLVALDPYAVGDVDVDTDGSVMRGEESITVIYGDTGAGPSC